MKRPFLALLVLLVTCSLARPAGIKNPPAVKKSLPLDDVPGVMMKNRANSQYLPDRIIIKLMPQTRTSLSKSLLGVRAIDQVLSRLSVTSVAQMFPSASAVTPPGEVDLSLMYAVTFLSPNDPFTIAEQLSTLDEVQYAEPWFIYPVHGVSPVSGDTFTPNDPSFPSQWALQKINAAQAWDVTQGDTTVVIAIVDTGVELNHPDIKANIWTNPGEIPNNGIDDDGNGYVDDVHGWDFIGKDYRNWREDNDPSPTAGNNAHGTHVAGIAAASTNNGIGIASIGFMCKILPVKCSADNDDRASGGSYVLKGYEGIVYAARMEAKVINSSWGGSGGSQFEQEIINFATQQGALVVAAAGNDRSNVFFSPAGYANVLGVAATDQSDIKAIFSNFGEFVDVSSPGVGIYSTLFPSTYDSWSGTSMASPLAAGLAGLVKSKFPNMTPVQVGEQIRVTSDNIDASNSLYAGQLGHGRINALKALTDSTLPSVRMVRFAITDKPGGNGDGYAQPAETLNVSCLFRNYLRPTSSGATVELTSVNGFMTVVNGTFPLVSLGTLDSISNAAAPFRVVVNPNVPQSYTAILQLRFTDGVYTDIQRFSFLVNPTYATHNINAIEMTLTNNGKLGFFDYPANEQGGGFVFRGTNHLFEGGLIIGSSSSQLVDVVRDDRGGQDADFSSSDFFTLKTPGLISQQDGHTTFTDNNASSTNKLGLQIELNSYAFSNPGDDRYIILSYSMKNTSPDTIKNMYVGIFLDWDIGNYDSDISAYDATRSLGYAYEFGEVTRKEYLGIRALDGAASYRSLDRDQANLTRGGKWDWISGGFGATSIGPTDIHHVLSSGPYKLAPAATQTVGFALVAGDSSLANIQQNSDAAQAKWNAIRNPTSVLIDETTTPNVFSLKQNYPNPFNPSTNFEFGIANFGLVSLKVFDLLGRETATIVNDNLQPGTYKVQWDASGLPSGVYIYRMQAGQFVAVRKLVILR